VAKTFINFVPSTVLAPSYQVTLDGNIYTLRVEWNLAAQRYYIRLSDLAGNLILYTAMVGSPIGINISSMVWTAGRVSVVTSELHGLTTGQVANVTITGATPDGYNGEVQAFATTRSSFTFLLPTDPGPTTVLGAVEQNINLTGGLFTSTLIWRVANAQFETT
jgi:uncharacterized protein DUF6983